MNKSDLFGGVAGLALVGIFAVWAYNIPTNHVTTMQDMIASSVQLEDYCSGTVIEDPDLSDGEQLTVLTAKHCMNAEDKIGSILHIHVPNIMGNTYDTPTDDGVKVIIKDISKDSDLVLLQGLNPKTDPKLPKMHVYGGIPQIGELSYAVGYPRAESRTISLGMLGYTINNTALSDVSVSGEWQKSTNAVQGGSSGGGLFIETDLGYELVGCLTWGYRGDEGAAYWTPVQEIRTFLEDNGGK